MKEGAATDADLEAIRLELEEMLDHVVPRPKVSLETTVGVTGPEWDGWWHMSVYRRHWSAYEGQPGLGSALTPLEP
ncbi:hypothetical protein ASE01_23670 [Nocardioides sp. Root190]|nr:hypothetical protein ASE01_23670 [Nocardioides sp. Root190]